MRIEEAIQQTTFKDPYQKALVNLLYTALFFDEKFQRYLKPFGITSQQYNVLRILRGQYPKQISVAEIKSRMMDKNSDMSRLVARLLTKKLIVKKECPQDKRASEIVITKRALSILAKLDEQLHQWRVENCGLSKGECASLSDTLDKLRK